jgi:hypothetical protein
MWCKHRPRKKTMKYCKDCKHYSGSNFCKTPQNGKSLVTGEPNVMFANVSRKDSKYCGLGAKYFEAQVEAPMPSMFRRLSAYMEKRLRLLIK